jgi:hypothetical protein
MAFRYFDIRNYKARPNELFLFDANVWIAWLNPKDQNQWHRKPYQKFLNILLNQKEDPNVILLACVLSEVLNRLLKDHYLDIFLRSDDGAAGLQKYPEEKDWFKKVYRPHAQFGKDRDTIFDSIQSFSTNLTFCEDGFDTYWFDNLKAAPTELDFTDWQIWEAARELGATIITDDGDFVLENFPILTARKQLLDLKS